MTFRSHDITPPAQLADLPRGRQRRRERGWGPPAPELTTFLQPGTALSQRHSGDPVFPTPEFTLHPPRSKPYQSGEILSRKMRLAESHASLTPRHLVGRGRKSPRQPPDQRQGGGGGAGLIKEGRPGLRPGKGGQSVQQDLITWTSFCLGSYSTCRQDD